MCIQILLILSNKRLKTLAGQAFFVVTSNKRHTFSQHQFISFIYCQKIRHDALSYLPVSSCMFS